jgi:hypothetical protein
LRRCISTANWPEENAEKEFCARISSCVNDSPTPNGSRHARPPARGDDRGWHAYLRYIQNARSQWLNPSQKQRDGGRVSGICWQRSGRRSGARGGTGRTGGTGASRRPFALHQIRSLTVRYVTLKITSWHVLQTSTQHIRRSTCLDVRSDQCFSSLFPTRTSLHWPPRARFSPNISILSSYARVRQESPLQTTNAAALSHLPLPPTHAPAIH